MRLSCPYIYLLERKFPIAEFTDCLLLVMASIIFCPLYALQLFSLAQQRIRLQLCLLSSFSSDKCHLVQPSTGGLTMCYPVSLHNPSMCGCSMH